MIITRFPPSPTGHAHIGSYRTAIFNYLFAKKNSGKFLLRIEDTDKVRSKQEYTDGIIESLSWLGLDYDGFSIQTENAANHKMYLEKLISEDKAYISKEEAKDGSGIIKDIIRFKNPNKKISFTDLILGDIEIDTTDLGDFVIARNIDDALYHFAVVIDDLESGVTHIIRGNDHTANTPRQIALYEALGKNIPIYAHIPLVLGEDKQKLSKRKGALSVLEYKQRGYMPEAIINAATFIGFNPGGEREIYSKEELIEVFDIEKVQKASATFNPVKLDWFNKEHIKRLSKKDYIDKIEAYHAYKGVSFSDKNIDQETLYKIYNISKERITTFSDIEKEVLDIQDYSVQNALDFIKSIQDDKTKAILEKVIELLNQVKDQEYKDIESIKNIIWQYAEQEGRGKVLAPLRLALTSKQKSIDPFSMIYILDKDKSISRIQDCVNAL